MSHRLSRLFHPRHIAVIGGGSWCTNLIHQCQAFGFDGAITPVHPTKSKIAGLPAIRDLKDLPSPPDAAFIGVNRATTITLVDQLAKVGSGGAICFASGFREAAQELADGGDLQDQLVKAAGNMPVLGPNCYGLINTLDNVALWPDQHGLQPVQRGVAILTQSSNIAITLTMQRRGLPIAQMITTGNQACVTLPEIARAVLDDPRITALGLHIEGVSDLAGLEAMAHKAHALGKSIVAIKVGASDQARAATLTHTASLAGSDAGADALFHRLGIGRVHSLSHFLETLRLLHHTGPLPTPDMAMACCSGGEASLSADTGLRHDLRFPPLSPAQQESLRAALGPRVALANPLDYHTYIWGDVPRMARTFAALAQGPQSLTGIVVDFPRADRCDPSDWDCVITSAQQAQRETGKQFALISTLSDCLTEDLAAEISAAGLLPMAGLDDTLVAIATAAAIGRHAPDTAPILPPRPVDASTTLTEHASKSALAAFGLEIPQAQRAMDPKSLRGAVDAQPLPLVIKAEGLAHKSDQGGVLLVQNDPKAALSIALEMPAASWLVEEMITDAVVELLVGVTCDPAHGYVLTLGAGGVLTEVHRDTTSLLVPATRDAVDTALNTLRIAPLLGGYRNQPPVARSAVLDAIMAVQDFVIAHHGRIAELEINPLICTATRAVAVDALTRLGETL